MANVVAKVETTGNTNIMVCERGASFGYNTLVTDDARIAHTRKDRLSCYLRCYAFRATTGRKGKIIGRTT